MKFICLAAAATAVKIQNYPIRQMAQEALDACDKNGDGLIDGTEFVECAKKTGLSQAHIDTLESVLIQNGKIPTEAFMSTAREHMTKKQAAALFNLANTDNSPTAITVKELVKAQPDSGYTQEQLESWFEDDIVIGKKGLKKAIKQLIEMGAATW